MATTAVVAPTPARPTAAQPWLQSARWDISFLMLSILLAALPYSVYILLGGNLAETASVQGSTAYQARLFVNNLVAILVGGPHMYATFTRTFTNRTSTRMRGLFVAAAILVPAAVVTMAVWSYQTYVWLLSIFFVMASLHALQQIVWLAEAYNLKARLALSWKSRVIDYGVVLTSLYPIAVYRMVNGDFKIGPVELKWVPFIRGWTWLPWLAGLAFAMMLILFVAKTAAEYRSGYVNAPKTILIALTVTLMFLVPVSRNLDTAFQGVNTWHSFQYLALTWYANKLWEQKKGRPAGFLHWLEKAAENKQPGSLSRRIAQGLLKIDRNSGWTTFYGVCLVMLPLSVVLGGGALLLWPHLHAGQPGADEAYSYIGILSVLLVHYVHDGLLFFDARDLV